MFNRRWIVAVLVSAVLGPVWPMGADAQRPNVTTRVPLQPVLDPAPEVTRMRPRDSIAPGTPLVIWGGPFRVADLQAELVTDHGRIVLPSTGGHESSVGFRITNEMMTGPRGARLVIRHVRSDQGNASEARVIKTSFKVVPPFSNHVPGRAGAVDGLGSFLPLWGGRLAAMSTSTRARCARGGYSMGVVVGENPEILGLGSTLLGRFGLTCRGPDNVIYAEDHGSAPGVQVRCPRDFHLYEVRGRAGLSIDRIEEIRCARVHRGLHPEFRTVSVGVGGTGGSSVSVRCTTPFGFLVVRITKNVAIDELAWNCEVRGR